MLLTQKDLLENGYKVHIYEFGVLEGSKFDKFGKLCVFTVYSTEPNHVNYSHGPDTHEFRVTRRQFKKLIEQV